jgi:hypothetical protein
MLYKTYTDGEESDRLVHPSQGRYIDSLTPHSSLRPNSCGIFTRTGVHDGIYQDLSRVSVLCTNLFERLLTWMGFWSVKR